MNGAYWKLWWLRNGIALVALLGVLVWTFAGLRHSGGARQGAIGGVAEATYTPYPTYKDVGAETVQDVILQVLANEIME